MNKSKKSKFNLKNITASPSFKPLTSSLLAIVIGLLVGLLIMIVSSPSTAFQAFGRLLMGPLRNPLGAWVGIGQLFYRSTPLIFTGLAVAFAFKAGVFNIGASGQYTMGLFVASIIGINGDALGFMQWPLALIGGALGGALWGAIPGIFKAFYNVNIVITGIMLNYIAVFFINGMIGGVLRSTMFDSRNNRTIPIDIGSRNPNKLLNSIFPNSGIDIGIVIAIVVVVITYIVLNKTVFGRNVKSVGLNKDASKYAGVNERKTIVLSMTISGMLAGLGGALFILAPSVYGLGNTYAVVGTVLSEGFDGIPIALLGHSNPIGVLFATFFVTYIKISNVGIQSLGIASETVNVIVAVILYFSAFSLIMGEYLSKVFKKRRELAQQTPKSAEVDV